MDERDERIAKNETGVRAANREDQQGQEEGGGAHRTIEVLCECGRPGCTGLISLTIAQYNDVHSQADRFVVVRGHENPQLEKVVEERADCLVVDKFGEAEEIAERESG